MEYLGDIVVRKGGGGHLGHLINGRTFRREVCSVTDLEFWFRTIGPFYLCSRQNSDLLRKNQDFLRTILPL